MGVRDQGFGLNFNQGFGSRSIMAGPGFDPNTSRYAGERSLLQQQQRGQEKQLGMQLGQRAQEAGLQDAASQRDYQAKMAGIQSQERLGAEGNRINMYAQTSRQGRFDKVLPYFQQALARYGNGNYQGGYQGGGQVGQQPLISDAPVYSQDQIQQQVNAQRSANDAATANRITSQRESMAGRGMSSQSPLLQALTAGFNNRNLATNTANERDTRMNAASMNASQVLKAQIAREQQFANRQQEEIERNKAYSGAINPLLSALSSMI